MGEREVKQVIVVRKDLNMRKGKLAAQVGHAVMKFVFDNNESDDPMRLEVPLNETEAIWKGKAFTKIVLGCDSEDQLGDLILKAKLMGIEVYSIVDSGRTEFHGEPTMTCAAFGPTYVDVVDKVTGHLKPL